MRLKPELNSSVHTIQPARSLGAQTRLESSAPAQRPFFNDAMRKTSQLKNLVKSSDLTFLMEAHNGLSAKIVEEAEFKGIWASGLSISAALGVRDNNEASWTQVLEVLEFMSDATSIPILLDGDTGYGNFNNMRRLVRKLEQRGVAGVCIEDKLFPKTNSFIDGEAQPLADIEEFSSKIKAGKDTQIDSDFQVVARVEAFIAGWGLAEALRRAEAYRQAGADAVLIHSKRNTYADIEAFMSEWGDRLPVVIVPTKYYSTPTDKFRDLGVSLVIWANHNVRASIRAMQTVSKRIHDDQSLINVEGTVATVSEIFRLQGADELKEAEKAYLPATGTSSNAVILAASRGEELGMLTTDIPKAMLKVGNKTILGSQIEEFKNAGIKEITVVRGYMKQAISDGGFVTLDNDEYETTSELYSLSLAADAIRPGSIFAYGDVVFRSYILNELLTDQSDITLMVDADIEARESGGQDYVEAARGYDKRLFGRPVRFKRMDASIGTSANGEFIGLWKVNERGAEIVREGLKAAAKRPDFRKMSLAGFFNMLAADHEISVRYIKGGWWDVDTIIDLQRVGEIG